MRLFTSTVAIAILLTSCAAAPDGEPLAVEPLATSGSAAVRCVAGGSSVPIDPQGHETIDAALGSALDLAEIDGAVLTREDQSDTWVSGSSSDPLAVIELHRPDGSDEWFLNSVTSCNPHEGQGPRIPAELPTGEVSALPAIVLVEGAEVGDIYTTDFAVDAAAFAELWDELGLAGTMPSVDFDSRVVLYFGAVESSSCPLGPMDGLVYNHGNESIHPLMSPVIPVATDDSQNIGCTRDAVRHAVLVAVDRADLPDGAFSLWISEDDPPGCCLDGLTFVAAGELNAPVDAEYEPLNAHGDLAVGETRIAYDVYTHCGVEWLGRSINGQRWHAVDLADAGAVGIDPVPRAWGKANDSLDLLMTLVDPGTLEVTKANSDVVVTYTPEDNAPGCD